MEDAPDRDRMQHDRRLHAALAALADFAENDDDVGAFLERHADLRDVLEPMLFVPGSGADHAADDEGARFGKFVLLRQIGRGGMGTVYAARDTVLHRSVALKILVPHLVFHPRSQARFRREAELMSTLSHSRIVKVFEIGDVGGQPFLAMELIDGVSLDELMRSLPAEPAAVCVRDLSTNLTRLRGERRLRHRAAPRPAAAADASGPTWPSDFTSLAVDWVVQVAEALEAAHRAGVVHRDVKPSNILVTHDGRAMLTDFGLARFQGEAGVTLSGEFAGTVHYAPPEQYDKAATLDGRSDVYSLGVTLYELLARRRPFAGDSILEVRERAARHDAPPLRTANPRVGQDLAAVVERAMEKAPERRYASAAEFAADLQRWRKGFPVQARPVSRLTRCRRWVARNRLASAFLAVLVVSTGAVSGLAWQAHLAVTAARTSELRANDLLVASVGDRITGQLQSLRNRAAGLFPTRPALVPLLQSLAIEGQSLTAELPQLEARLADLRNQGTRTMTDDDAARADRAPWERQLAVFSTRQLQAGERQQQVGSSVGPDAVAEIEREARALEQRRVQLEQIVRDYRRHRFPSPLVRLWHDRLEDAVRELATFAHGPHGLADLRRRCETAAGMARALDEHAGAWRTAVAAIEADPRFSGVRLVPQPGLLPLGADPVSGLQEFVHMESGAAPARRGEDRSMRVDRETGIVLVLVPPGRYRAPDGDERPLDAFFCSKFEVSIDQMRRLVDRAPPDAFGWPRWRMDPELHPCTPARHVSWELAAELLPLFGLRLPTGAQWEHACRAGTTSKWYTGDDEESLLRIANFRTEDASPRLWLVDHVTQPNAFGLHHMHGNVAEWLADHASGVLTDERTGERTTTGYLRWVAGGFFADTAKRHTQSGVFNQISATLAAETLGLRPVRALDVSGSSDHR